MIGAAAPPIVEFGKLMTTTGTSPTNGAGGNMAKKALVHLEGLLTDSAPSFDSAEVLDKTGHLEAIWRRWRRISC